MYNPAVRGECHCGNVTVELVTSQAAHELRIRRCACAFCRKHGARTTTDANAKLTITVSREAELSRYGFSTLGAEFLICRCCGVYVAALLDGVRATLNANILDDAAAIGEGELVSYDGESAEARRARRAASWTPAELILLG